MQSDLATGVWRPDGAESGRCRQQCRGFFAPEVPRILRLWILLTPRRSDDGH